MGWVHQYASEWARVARVRGGTKLGWLALCCTFRILSAVCVFGQPLFSLPCHHDDEATHLPQTSIWLSICARIRGWAYQYASEAGTGSLGFGSVVWTRYSFWVFPQCSILNDCVVLVLIMRKRRRRLGPSSTAGDRWSGGGLCPSGESYL